MIASFDSVRWEDLVLLRRRWGLLLAFGIAVLGLGLLAFFNVVLATVASIYYVGAILLIAGIAQIVYAFQVRGWKHFLNWALVGALYVIAGLTAFINPLLTSAVLTMLLGLALIAAGALRIVASLAMRPHGFWLWLLAAGVITALTGLVVLLGWPFNSLWLIGLILAIDLTWHGVTLIGFAFALRRHVPENP